MQNEIPKLTWKIYGYDIDAKAVHQFHEAMKNDFAIKGALMPDAHLGYSLPIGGVVGTEGVILPAWVGYDIGCGMTAICTSLKRENLSDIEKEVIFHEIYRIIPIGLGKDHKHSQKWMTGGGLDRTEVVDNLISLGGMKGLGTLGSGNHFIEVGYDENDMIWVIVHSGSRGLGYKTAKHYMIQASPDNKAREGHYGFDVNSDLGKDYIMDMNFCLEFALESRKRMAYIVMKILHEVTAIAPDNYSPEIINRNHNHAEYNMSEDLWIHRKGATHAEDGMMGVIPANMRDGAFIVKGKGNLDSLNSSSHGAGRVMSRGEARRGIDINDFTEAMVGVIAKVDTSTIDEAPMAYKDINMVMQNQEDLVDVIHHVKPLINIKG